MPYCYQCWSAFLDTYFILHKICSFLFVHFSLCVNFAHDVCWLLFFCLLTIHFTQSECIPSYWIFTLRKTCSFLLADLWLCVGFVHFVLLITYFCLLILHFPQNECIFSRWIFTLRKTCSFFLAAFPLCVHFVHFVFDFSLCAKHIYFS